MTVPLISIVIPAYNAEAHLAATLDSVLAQTETRWELIVVDDGSSDGTAQLVQEYVQRDPRIRLLRQENSGQAQARNHGLSEACPLTSSVIFFDHDDVWEPQALELLYAALEQNPDAVAAHGVARYIDAQGARIQQGELEAKVRVRQALRESPAQKDHADAVPQDQPTTFATLIMECCFVSPGLVLIRRSALDQAGLLDTMPTLGFSSLDDWDLWLRLSCIGVFAVVDEVILNYRLHGSNLSRHRRAMCLGEWHVRRKYLTSPLLDAGQKQMAAVMYLDFVQKMRREMATHLRRIVYHNFSQSSFFIKQFKPFKALSALWRGASLYRHYLKIRQMAGPEGVWPYTNLEDDLLPESLRRSQS